MLNIISSRFIAIALGMAILLPVTTKAGSGVIRQYIPAAEEVGSGRLTVMFWNVYDAVLYAPKGKWDANAPYALSLSYLREFDGKDIAARSVEEMRAQGFGDEVTLATWHQKMETLFPNVDENTTLTGIRDEKGHAIFYQNGARIGIIQDTEFSDWFFGIWLKQETSQPNLRKKLLGMI